MQVTEARTPPVDTSRRLPVRFAAVELRQGLVEAAEQFEHAVRAGLNLESRRELLAEALHSVVLARLARLGTGALADDLAQIAVPRVLDAFSRGCTTAARLPAYADEAARNAYFDHRRRAVNRRETPTGPDEMPAVASSAPTPEESVSRAQDEIAVVRGVREALAKAPAAYRDALTQHYLEERPIQELVEDEITARLLREGRDSTDSLERARIRTNARQTVDQRISRARNWLKSRLAIGGAGVRSVSADASCE